MKKIQGVAVGLGLALLLAAGAGLAADAPAAAAKVSTPLEYRGYSFAEYRGIEKRSEYVAMSDGVKLAVDLYLPADGPAAEGWPVILEYTPYTGAYIDLNNGPVHRL